MTRPMEGIRVLEVAQFTFVPAAGAVLADWGADVIKVEHAEKGDAQRGLLKVLGLESASEGSTFVPIMEGPNRGKRSIGLALEKDEAREVLYELVRSSDVFLTNFLPDARRRLGIDVDDIRAINPDIIYTLGSGFGPNGPDAGKGGYDGTAFWARGGSADGATPSDSEFLARMPGGAYGDNIGGMTIAGGITAALFHRMRTGEAPVVDVSLLGVGAWATQFNVNLAMMMGGPLPKHPKKMPSKNPLTGVYQTSDSGWIQLVMLQPGRYWEEFVTAIDRKDLAEDPRFASADLIMENADAAVEILEAEFAARTRDEWVEVLGEIEGQWSIVQNAWDLAQDVQLRENGQIASVVDAEGVPRELVASPVQFDRKPLEITRAPLFAEHTDEILLGLGKSDEDLINLKIAGAAT
ncbi:CoA transferase [Nocardioides sp. YIM 152588]|uniref:CaiB/BaiF CoA transferase family protein n=1 Tax=Nocardioides sp. YIM 152588 TaxID=3158259 RepID=UPI0032E4C9AD